MPRITLAEATQASFSTTNTSKFLVRPVADRLLWVCANYAPVSPNAITVAAFLLVLAAVPFYVRGDLTGFRLGAALFYVAFVLDTIDGSLARILKKTSAFGAWLDVTSDFVRSALLGAALGIGAYRYTGDIVALYLTLAAVPLALFHYFLAEISLRLTGVRPGRALKSRTRGMSARLERLGIVPNPFGLTDMEAVYLVIAPCMGYPIEGLAIACVGATVSRLAVALLLLRTLTRPIEAPPNP